MLIYLILFPLRLQGVINSNYFIITIPIFLVFGSGVFYFIFLIPALFESKLYFEFVLIISYILNGFSFLIIINTNFDNNSHNLFTVMLIPIFIAFSIHILYDTYNVLKGGGLVNYIPSYLILLTLTVDSILLCLKYDRRLPIQNWIMGALLILAFQIYAIEKCYSVIRHENEGDEKENIINKI